ncbi:MAG: hypothetical protein ACRET8_00545 [Burkholderiales bacterium]
MTVIDANSVTPAPIWLRALRWWLAQWIHMLPAVIFFFISFNLILFTKQVALHERGIPFSGFLVATLAALLVGKAVLVTDQLRFMRRFEGAPLIQPILFKSAIYWAVTFAVRIADGFVQFVREGGAPGAFPQYVADAFLWQRFVMIQLWLMVLFMIYVTIFELNMLFGDGELPRLFFRWRSSEAKLTRRQRIRLLVRLSRLTETHDLAEFKDASTPVHAELVAIVTQLASRPARHAIA